MNGVVDAVLEHNTIMRIPINDKAIAASEKRAGLTSNTGLVTATPEVIRSVFYSLL
jgi:hypothetical protein